MSTSTPKGTRYVPGSVEQLLRTEPKISFNHSLAPLLVEFSTKI